MPLCGGSLKGVVGLAWLGILLGSAAGPAGAQPRATVSGYVQDAETGEKLIGAAVYAPDLGAGTVTNRYGFYSLTLPAGRARLAFSYLGYAPQAAVLTLRQDTTLVVDLQPATVGLDSLVVIGERADRIEDASRMSTIDVPLRQVEALPALLGEVDVLKALQLLPGVQSGSEGTSGLYVRGGGPDQNLILLDGTPVYNASHLFGFFSVFNTDAINNVELTKGGFPARYGGRLSSVVEINMRDGNRKQYAMQGSVGLVASRLTVEGPIRRDRSSFIVSARRTYLDLVARPFMPEDEKAGYYFYDLNAKLNHVVSPRDRLYLSLYAGDDRFGYDYQDEGTTRGHLAWGNVTAALRWNHLFSNKLFSNTTLTFSRYAFETKVDEVLGGTRFGLRYFSGIRDGSARIDFDYLPGPRHYVRFGVGGTHHTFNPGALQVEDTDPTFALDTTFTSFRVGALELVAYAEDDFRLTDRVKVNAGVHASTFAVQGRGYTSLEPRLSARLRLGRAWALKGSFAAMRQYIHLLTNAGIGLPTDLWVPATARVRPQQAWQAAAGLAGSFRQGRYTVSIEGYYKQMRNLIAYRQGATFIDPANDWQDKVVTDGQGRAYGAEVFVQQKAGRTTGWLGYTLSWADRRFDAFNQGRAYPYRYDRRHDVSLVVSHVLSPRFDVSATWVYGTGNAVTLPIARYSGRPSLPDDEAWPDYPEEILYYGGRNSFRMPAYHRLDLGLQFYFARTPREHMLALGVYNAYNRKNPFFLDFDNEDRIDPQTGRWETKHRLVGYAIFPILPSLTYRFKF